jgi:anaerobic ribonucleoside-triphosphate reductase activating protein
MKNVVIFDLFGTVIKEETHDWKAGLNHIFENYLDTDDIDKVLELTKDFKETHMSNRSITYKEPKMIDQLKLIQENFGFKQDASIFDIEFAFLDNSRTVSLAHGVRDVFDYLKNEKVEIYIMSNTIYSGETIQRYLNKLNVGSYIKRVFTSSDFGYRKPHKGFFNYVYSEVNNDNTLDRKDITFIGDSLTKDAIAGREFGFRTVLISDDKDDTFYRDMKLKVVSNMLEFNQFLVDEFIYVNSFLGNYSMSDGPGNRLVLFLQGCKRHCEGCHNKETWDKTEGKRVHIDDLVIDVIHKLNKYTRNLTVSGGEPLDQTDQVISFLDRLKQFKINICLYTGYEFEEVNPLVLDNLDYIKTGKFIDNLKDTTNGYYGSSNQNLWKKGENGKWIKMIEK